MDDHGTATAGVSRVARLPAVVREVLAAGSALVAVFSVVVRVGYDSYYGELDLTPEQVGLGPVATISRAAAYAGVVGVLAVVWLSFAVAIYRLTAPFHGGLLKGKGLREPVSSAGLLLLSVGMIVAIPTLLLWLLARGPGFRLVAPGFSAVAGNAILFGGLVSSVAFEAGARTKRLGAFCQEQIPRVGGLLAVSFCLALLVAWATNFWAGAEQAGREVRARGELARSRFGYLNVTVAPARVLPKTGDPLGVCDGRRRAVLLGRSDAAAHVLLLPEKPLGGPTEVVTLENAEYGVMTTGQEPQACNS